MEIGDGKQWVCDFAEGSKDMRDLLGGKGANVAEMTRVLGPDRVPAGFTITTEACVEYMRAGGIEPEGLEDEVAAALERLEARAERRLGHPEDPLLVSVRSGARESMPGMLDTVLNLGLNDESVAGLARTTDNERFAWDSYRRFVQMFGNVSRGVPGERFEAAIRGGQGGPRGQAGHRARRRGAAGADRPLQGALRLPAGPAGAAAARHPGRVRLLERQPCLTYRRIHRIPDDWGTAVNVQQMVFGNKGDTSGSGVAFSRDEVTGEPEPSGDFLRERAG